ncbi:MAG: phytanoyl-CoA dioxygenase family protein [Acidimicrobiales bacterium]
MPRDFSDAFAALDRDGFCVVPDVLDPTVCEEARHRVLEQATAERERGLDHEYQAEAEGEVVNQWVYQLVNKGAVLRQLPVHPVAAALAEHVLGKQYLLSTMDSHITAPGNLEMPLHADQWWMPPPQMPGERHVRQGDIERAGGPIGDPTPADHPITGPLIVNVMWMLTDFTAENGATRLIRGSHLSGRRPDPTRRYDEVIGEGRAGSIVAWDGRTWHAAGVNTSDSPRVGVTTYFCGPMVRQLGNQVHGLRTDVRAEVDEDFLALLGFRPFSSYGMTDDPGDAIVRAGDETVGELRAGG